MTNQAQSRAEPRTPSIAAVIVYFRTPGPLASCIRALRRQTHALEEVMVVDNSSRIDGSDAPPVPADGWRWEPMPANVGFAAACNAGARLTRSDHVLILNADTELGPDACARLLEVMQGDPCRAVVGPRIYDVSGQVELSAREFPSLKTGLLGRSSLATRLLRRTGAVPAGVAMALSGAPHAVDWVSGACMLIRRSSYELVGGFDEGYWMYWEDADLCRRLAQRGLSTWIMPAAAAHHRTGSSGRSPATVRAFHASAARYLDRHLARGPATRALGHLVLATRCRLVLVAQRRRGTR